jgi:hypothetical protein
MPLDDKSWALQPCTLESNKYGLQLQCNLGDYIEMGVNPLRTLDQVILLTIAVLEMRPLSSDLCLPPNIS